MELSVKFNRPSQKTIAILVLSLIAAGLALLFFQHHDISPIPPNIKKQLSFQAVYPASPASVAIDSNSYNYQAESQALTFKVQFQTVDIILTEQPLPDNFAAGSQIYYQSLGLHPYAQFQAKVGPAALLKFYKSGSLEAQGQTAIMTANKTLILAHPSKDLTNDDWKVFLNSLRLSR